MADGILIAKAATLAPITEKSEKLEDLSETFQTMIAYAHPFAIRQITAHAKKIGADIFAIRHEVMPYADPRDIFIEGTYYRLKE